MHEGIATDAREHRETKDQSTHHPREWERAHAELVRLSQERARLDSEEGHWLLVALRSRTHVCLGYASFVEYIERLFGYSPRWTAEKLRVAEALATLPSLARAVANGELPWSHARELTRVATTETESEWLASAQGRTARDIERLVSGHRPGSRPDDRPDPTAVRHVLRFEVTAITFAAFREALANLRRDSDGPLDDDEALLLMARRTLGGPADAGESSYQMVLTTCEHCRHGTVEGRGQQVALEGEVVEMAACDATSFAVATTEIAPADDPTHVGQALPRAKQSVPPSVRRLVHRRDRGRCRIPGCRHAVYVDVHHSMRRRKAGRTIPKTSSCSARHTIVPSIRGGSSSRVAAPPSSP